jgi:hypothetical protein
LFSGDREPSAARPSKIPGACIEPAAAGKRLADLLDAGHWLLAGMGEGSPTRASFAGVERSATFGSAISQRQRSRVQALYAHAIHRGGCLLVPPRERAGLYRN